MDAGPSSAPVLHQMQPAGPRPAPLPARTPGAPPRGALRPTAIPGQRQGPVVPMPTTHSAPHPRGPLPAPTRNPNRHPNSSAHRNPIPPPVFRFQPIKKTALPEANSTKPVYTALTPLPNPSRAAPPFTKPPKPAVYNRPAPPPSSHPPANFNRHEVLGPPTTSQITTQRPNQTHSLVPPHRNYLNGSSSQKTHDKPSTSTAPPSFNSNTPLKSSYTKVTETNREELQRHRGVWLNSQGERKAEKIIEEKFQTTIELPENCKLFQYQCQVNGVARTLLVPMPMNATEDDVMKMLPESFADMATQIFADDETPKQQSTLSFPEGASPRFERITGMEDKFSSFNDVPHPPTQESPILVNPKQYNRIISRRKMRQKLEMSGRLPLERQKYLHESRHLHAIKRRRGVDGRFDPKLPPGAEEGESSNSGHSKKLAQPLSRPVTTYAEIRPAHEMISLYDHPTTSSTPSTSSAPYFDRNEPITSYQQYQQHVQFSDSEHYRSNPSNGTLLGESRNGQHSVLASTSISIAEEHQPETSHKEDFTSL